MLFFNSVSVSVFDVFVVFRCLDVCPRVRYLVLSRDIHGLVEPVFPLYGTDMVAYVITHGVDHIFRFVVRVVFIGIARWRSFGRTGAYCLLAVRADGGRLGGFAAQDAAPVQPDAEHRQAQRERNAHQNEKQQQGS